MEQERLLEWTAHKHATSYASSLGVKEKLLALGMGEDKIQKRGFQIPDPLQEEGALQLQSASLRERMCFYEEEVSGVFEAFYPAEISLPQQMIHVTCTGYVAPSPAQKLLSLRNETQSFVTHAYHMGCYASIPAVRIASGSLATGISSVDIVHTELCSLHFHPFTQETEQLVIQTLFADGFIKYSVQHENSETKGLKIITLHEETIPGSLKFMQWRCEDTCHVMTLSKKVPLYIMQALEGFFTRLVEKAGLDIETIRSSAYFAIHPGGTKIFHYVQEELGLAGWQVAHSLAIFQQYGNMSSATLPHIWEKMLNELPKDAYIVSFAYGPGLTMVGALLKKL
jgi:predicted naringenin-chalcone synthase